jgi:subtilase-type serine protease
VVSVGFHDVASTRLIDLGYDTFIANAAYDAGTFGIHGEFGAVFNGGRVNVQPFIALGYLSNSTDGFSESGAGDFGLLVGDSDADSLTSTLGMRFSGMWKAGGVRLIPDAEIAWRHEFLDERQGFSAAFIEDPSTPFSIVSSALSRDSALVSAGVGAQVSRNFVLFLDYNGVLNSAANTHTASAGLRATW